MKLYTLKNMKKLPFLSLIFVFLLSSCQQKAVEWPALSQLDDLTIKIEKAAYDHNHKLENEYLLESQQLIQDVTSSIPDNAQNKEMLDALLVDLKSISMQVSQLEDLDHDQKHDLSLSIHPLVAVIMKTAGVPHTHKEISHEESSCEVEGHEH